MGDRLGGQYQLRFHDMELTPVPVNLKDEDAFQLTIEEYLHSLVSLTEELARLAVNSVTLGDFEQPARISAFVKVCCLWLIALISQELHAGFQILNLKNDSLRRRSDAIKYQANSFPLRGRSSFVRSRRSKTLSTISRYAISYLVRNSNAAYVIRDVAQLSGQSSHRCLKSHQSHGIGRKGSQKARQEASPETPQAPTPVYISHGVRPPLESG